MPDFSDTVLRFYDFCDDRAHSIIQVVYILHLRNWLFTIIIVKSSGRALTKIFRMQTEDRAAAALHAMGGRMVGEWWAMHGRCVGDERAIALVLVLNFIFWNAFKSELKFLIWITL